MFDWNGNLVGLRKKERKPTDDIKKFYHNGYYYEDIVGEIEYLTDRLKEDLPESLGEIDEDNFDPDLMTKQDAVNALDYWNSRLVEFRAAFEAQRPKIDYDDGSWE